MEFPGEMDETDCFDVPGRLNVLFETFGGDLNVDEPGDFPWIGFGFGFPGEIDERDSFDVLGRLNMLFKTFDGELSTDRTGVFF